MKQRRVFSASASSVCLLVAALAFAPATATAAPGSPQTSTTTVRTDAPAPAIVAAASRASLPRQSIAVSAAAAATVISRDGFTVTPPPPPPPPPPVAAPEPVPHQAPARPAVISNPSGAQAIAAEAVAARGWGSGEFDCLVALWSKESGWRTNAGNQSSGAYGIPQALPGSKMAAAGADWESNPATQISWGLTYISGRYTAPCGAWEHSESAGWY